MLLWMWLYRSLQDTTFKVTVVILMGVSGFCYTCKWSKLWTRHRLKIQPPLLKSWEQKHGTSACPLHLTLPKRWANHLSSPAQSLDPLLPSHHTMERTREPIIVFTPSYCSRNPDKALPEFLISSHINFYWIGRTRKASQVVLVVKNPPASAGDPGLTPELGRFPGGHGSPLQYSCLENSMDRGAWRAIVQGVAKSQTWLRD